MSKKTKTKFTSPIMMMKNGMQKYIRNSLPSTGLKRKRALFQHVSGCDKISVQDKRKNITRIAFHVSFIGLHHSKS